MAQYVCVFEDRVGGWSPKRDRVEFDASDDQGAYRHVIDQVLWKDGGIRGLLSLLLYRGATEKPNEMMRWRRGSGWGFTDGRPQDFIDVNPAMVVKAHGK